MGGMNNMAGGMGMDRMGSGFDRMGPAMGGGLDRNMDIDRGFVPGPMGGGMRERLGSKGNQIFVRNVSNEIERNHKLILYLCLITCSYSHCNILLPIILFYFSFLLT